MVQDDLLQILSSGLETTACFFLKKKYQCLCKPVKFPVWSLFSRIVYVKRFQAVVEGDLLVREDDGILENVQMDKLDDAQWGNVFHVLWFLHHMPEINHRKNITWKQWCRLNAKKRKQLDKKPSGRCNVRVINPNIHLILISVCYVFLIEVAQTSILVISSKVCERVVMQPVLAMKFSWHITGLSVVH